MEHAGADQRKVRPEMQGESIIAPSVKPLRPRIDHSITNSGLSKRQMRKRMSVGEEVDLDLLKPESSAWLKRIFQELRDPNLETRFYALCRFEAVLHKIVLKGPIANATFASYVLERGILDEVVRLLKAAKSQGDIYLVAGGVDSTEEALQGRFLVLSKVEYCFKVLNGLMADARTTRFIRRSIPDLLFLFEGSYRSELPLMLDERGREMRVPHLSEGLRDEEKTSALDALGSFTLWTPKEVKVVIRGREVLFRQVKDDCLAGGKLSKSIIDRTITTISVLVDDPSDLPFPPDDFFKVAVKALETSRKPDVIKLALNLSATFIKERPAFLTSKTVAAEYTGPLLALATCSTLEQYFKSLAYKLLCVVDQEIFDPIFAGSNHEEELEKLVRESRAAAARRVQFCRAFAAYKEPAFLRNSDLSLDLREEPSCQPRDYVLLVTPEQHKAQRKPPRKCSRTDCPNSESASREFKLCSNCRLAIYCSRECQKVAWKEGHKARCQAAGTKEGRKGNEHVGATTGSE